jgi:hypothetical protein
MVELFLVDNVLLFVAMGANLRIRAVIIGFLMHVSSWVWSKLGVCVCGWDVPGWGFVGLLLRSNFSIWI